MSIKQYTNLIFILKFECTLLYQSHFNDTSRLYIRNLPLKADLFKCLFVQDLQIPKKKILIRGIKFLQVTLSLHS